MFALRNKGDAASVRALAAGLACSSALFRHEIAFVLGQVLWLGFTTLCPVFWLGWGAGCREGAAGAAAGLGRERDGPARVCGGAGWDRGGGGGGGVGLLHRPSPARSRQGELRHCARHGGLQQQRRVPVR